MALPNYQVIVHYAGSTGIALPPAVAAALHATIGGVLYVQDNGNSTFTLTATPPGTFTKTSHNGV